MSRSGKAELERRIDEVYDLLVTRVSSRAIVGYCAKKWGVGERQAFRYIAGATGRVLEAARASREEQLAKALASYNALYAKQVAAGRFGEARQTLDSIVKLLGLAAPEKLEVYDFSGYSDEQLAQEVAHELPELLREAERLTEGTAETGADEEGRHEPLDPPHPDA